MIRYAEAFSNFNLLPKNSLPLRFYVGTYLSKISNLILLPSLSPGYLTFDITIFMNHENTIIFLEITNF